MSSASASSQCGLRSQRLLVRLARRRRPRRALEVDVARQLLAPGPDGDVRLLAADRHVGLGGVRDAEQQVLDLRLDGRQLGLDVGQALADLGRSGAERGDLGAVRLRAALDRLADRLRRRVALGRGGRRPRPGARAGARRRRAPRRRARGPRPCRSRPCRIASGSSRSRCSPTLMRIALMPEVCRRRRPPAGAPTTNSGSSLASSQPARGPFGRPRNARYSARKARPGLSPPAVAVSKIAACQASPSCAQRPLVAAPSLARRAPRGTRARVGVELRGRRRAASAARELRARPGRTSSSHAAGGGDPLLEDRLLARRRARSPFSAAAQRRRRRRPGSGSGVARCANGNRNARGLGVDVGVRVEQRVPEDRREARRQLALHVAAGDGVAQPVELVEQARDRRRCPRDRTRSPGSGAGRRNRSRSCSGGSDLGDPVRRRRRGPSRSTSSCRRCSGTRRAR